MSVFGGGKIAPPDAVMGTVTVLPWVVVPLTSYTHRIWLPQGLGKMKSASAEKNPLLPK